MSQVILTVAANWFSGAPYGLSPDQLESRQKMTFDLTHNWLPGNVDRVVFIVGDCDETLQTRVEVSLREFGLYDYRTTDFAIDVGVESVPAGPEEATVFLQAIQDELQKRFELFLLSAQERFGDIDLPSATFRILCHRLDAAVGVHHVANLVTGCIKPATATHGQPIGAA